MIKRDPVPELEYNIANSDNHYSLGFLFARKMRDPEFRAYVHTCCNSRYFTVITALETDTLGQIRDKALYHGVDDTDPILVAVHTPASKHGFLVYWWKLQ